MKKIVILQGSSKSDGDTSLAVNYLSEQTGYPIIDLKLKSIGHFDYEFKNKNDDFLPLFGELVSDYELIIFATPVYWYSMSGIMKVFFDRISEVLKTDKAMGRQLRGMKMAVLSCGYDKELKDGFHMPFKESANYLGMDYITDVHCYVRDEKLPNEVIQTINEFITKL